MFPLPVGDGGKHLSFEKKYLRGAGLILLISLVASANGEARPLKATQNPNDLALKPVSDLNQSGAGTTVVGGKKADTKDWEASLYPSSGNDHCSATLVGPKVLLLAAHCVGDGKRVSFTKFGTPHTAVCAHSKQYKDDDNPDHESADYALCLVDGAPISQIKFETVNQDSSLIRKGAAIRLTGFGCVQYPASGGNDGIFRTANTTITAVPGQPESERNTILTGDPKAGTCPGDSGSGAYVYLVPDIKRTIVAVNSRVDATFYSSYLSSLTTADATKFISDWISDYQNRIHETEFICGVNLNSDVCQ